MTQREKTLAVGLLGVLAVVGGAVAINALAVQPYREARAELDKAQDVLDAKELALAKERNQLKSLLKRNPRLAVWKKISLPPMSPELRQKKNISPAEKKKAHVRNLQVEYDRYLRDLMRKSGLVGIDISNQEVKEVREAVPKGQVGTTKPPVAYERVPFKITGQGQLDAVLRMFRDFHRTSALHQVRSFNLSLVERKDGEGDKKKKSKSLKGMLNVNMTVEALIVPGAEERSGLLPEKMPTTARVLAEPSRDYDAITRKHPFLGIAPVASVTETGSARETERAKDVLRFVRLTTICFNGRRWEAYVYDQGKGGPEKRVNADGLSEFSIRDRFGNDMLSGEVMLIDEEQVVFRAGGKFYRLRCGDYFQAAVQSPLSRSAVKKLGLDPDAKASVDD